MTVSKTNNPQTVPVPFYSILSILLFQIIFYGVIGLIIYWMITLNWKWLFITCIITFIQLSINGKNMKYINIVLNVLKPQEYFSISRYY